MDIDAVFLPVAEELIDQVFPTPDCLFVDGTANLRSEYR